METKTKVRNRLDKLWSLKIRSKGYCEVCGKSDGLLNAHHAYGRKNLSTRWDLRNGVCLCATHHTMGNQSAHNNPIWFIKWMEENRREDYDYLVEKMKETPKPYSLKDYLKIEEELKKL